MTSKSDNLLKRLLATFKPEAEEHIKAMSSGLVELEKEKEESEKQKLIESIYRESHSLKGAARAVNLRQVESICQAMETVLAAFKHGELPSTTGLFDAIHHCVDTLAQIIAATYDDTIKGPASIDDVLQRLNHLAQPADPSTVSTEAERYNKTIDFHDDSQVASSPSLDNHADAEVLPRDLPLPTSDTVRIDAKKLDALLVQAEGMLGIKLSNAQRATELHGTCKTIENWFREWNKIQPDLNLFQQLIEPSNKQKEFHLSFPPMKRLNDFLSWTHQQFQVLESELQPLSIRADQDSRITGRMVDDLLEDMKQVVMLPCSTLLESFPKIVRDLSRGLHKEVDWSAHGTNIEIDKRILEELKDPLIHMIRNCVDHGIETPEDRERRGKPRRGKIRLTVDQIEGGKVKICMTDDGAGIDFEKVKSAAIERGLLADSEQSVLEEAEAMSLIFSSELSTSPIITNISGRGLGLAIVKEKIVKLGGQISVKTTINAGTSFCISLPVSLATFRGILVYSGGQALVVPSIQVDCVTRVRRDSIQTIENRDTILFDKHPIALVSLDDVLSIKSLAEEREIGTEYQKEVESDMVSVLILGSADHRIAFSVSQVLREQEVLVKSLPFPVVSLRNISGATLLGDGRVAPILNVAGLIHSALSVHGSQTHSMRESATAAAKQKKSILVAEDSITSRMLLQNILESANYEVQTEVDGMAAWTALKTGGFDLLVSDVQMPRMNGFELTAKIRNDTELSDMPVVLVTSLEKREDLENGVEAGANAYIVKSSFDQSDLLKVIEKLI